MRISLIIVRLLRMKDLSRDPIVNAISNGVRRGIQLCVDNGCLGSAVILILSGIDTMAYLAMPANQQQVKSNDFVDWADRYVKFRCEEQLTGTDLYGARCGMLHQYGVSSKLSRKGKCRMVGYMDRSIPEVLYAPDVSNKLVLVSVPALATAFFEGIDQFLPDLFSDAKKAAIAEKRLQTLIH